MYVLGCGDMIGSRTDPTLTSQSRQFNAWLPSSMNNDTGKYGEHHDSESRGIRKGVAGSSSQPGESLSKIPPKEEAFTVKVKKGMEGS